MNVLIIIKEFIDMSSKNYILLDFTKYLSFSKVQKNCKVVNV